MRSLAGTMTGSSIDAEDTLSFSSLQQIRPMIETVPLANAAEAYGRMMRNEARFRIVLVTDDRPACQQGYWCCRRAALPPPGQSAVTFQQAFRRNDSALDPVKDYEAVKGLSNPPQ